MYAWGFICIMGRLFEHTYHNGTHEWNKQYLHSRALFLVTFFLHNVRVNIVLFFCWHFCLSVLHSFVAALRRTVCVFKIVAVVLSYYIIMNTQIQTHTCSMLSISADSGRFYFTYSGRLYMCTTNIHINNTNIKSKIVVNVSVSSIHELLYIHWRIAHIRMQYMYLWTLNSRVMFNGKNEFALGERNESTNSVSDFLVYIFCCHCPCRPIAYGSKW